MPWPVVNGPGGKHVVGRARRERTALRERRSLERQYARAYHLLVRHRRVLSTVIVNAGGVGTGEGEGDGDGVAAASVAGVCCARAG